MLEVALLGTGGMMPLPNRFLTSLLIRYNGEIILTDCGEGTQVTLKQTGFGFKNISAICFTHFHADHISGIPGLLLAMANSGRTEPVTIIGPKGLQYVVSCLCVIAQNLTFEVEFIELSLLGAKDLSVCGLNVSALPVLHRATCFGYSFTLKRAGKFDADRAKALNIPLKMWNPLQKGLTMEGDGVIYTPEMVLGPERKGIKVSYITDSRPTRDMAGFVRGSDLFICEGIHGDDEKMDKVREHKHMIFAEAAKIAKDGNVAELWLTHFSPALVNPQEYLKNASSIFTNTVVPKDRMTKTIIFSDD